MRHIAVKVTLGLFFLGVLVLVYGLKQPPIFLFNQVVNRALAFNEENILRTVANLLVQLEIAQDWSNSRGKLHSITDYPLVSFAATEQNSYPYQTYDTNGRPNELRPGLFNPPSDSRHVYVSSIKEILSAIQDAQPGQVITIRPGTYDLKVHSISVNNPGRANAPIYLRAETFGTVTLRMTTLEGFHISQPYWVFENLKIRGECTQHFECEHAFHIVGNGHSITLRNNELVNFNAPVKVNLRTVNDKTFFPNQGLLEYNSIFNTTPRKTNNPVTLLNINSADDWVVRGNFVADFSKNGGDQVSYGGFMKGNSNNGIFERNLVMCEHRIPADAGSRVGLSFGGGGTASKYCKKKNCTIEHSNGTIRNNIIMNCSRDVGIYLNRAKNSRVYHNLLYNNLGIDVRFESSTAQISSNIISGRIKNRDDGHSHSSNNVVGRDCIGTTLRICSLRKLYAAPEKTDFRLSTINSILWKTQSPIEGLTRDFCGQEIIGEVNPGPIQYATGLNCLGASLP